MNVLVIGNGGREHALCWKIKQSPLLGKLFQLPYSAAIGEIAESLKVSALDFEEIYKICRDNKIELVVVGPEEPLSKGLADFLISKGVKVFGPKRQGATLEASKQVAKEFMYRNYIPTAGFKILYDANYAKEYVKGNKKYPLVIKADGLAAGKGVRICLNEEEALAAVRDFMEERIFGISGSKIIVEEYLDGYECSVMALVDGNKFVMLPVSRDHKRLVDNDEGPNTGGMGAFCPVDLKDELLEEIKNEVLWRFITGILKEKISYQGVIYAGLMITKEGPRVLEFNCRFGDPETQSIVPLIKDDLLELLFQAASGDIKKEKLELSGEKCVSVVLASEGYPTNPVKGDEIVGLDETDKDVLVFHAATKKEKGEYFTNGGRILNVSALGPDLEKAREKVYANVGRINFRGMHFRRDIGGKIENRE